MTAGFVRSAALSALTGIAHAFFTREGGVSAGLYASLNGGVGSQDNKAHDSFPAGVSADNEAHDVQQLVEHGWQ